MATYEEQLVQKVKAQFNKKVQAYIDKLQSQLDNLQQQFFFVLVNQMSAVSRPPALGQFTPVWQALTKDYTERREEQFGVPENQFFYRTGQLATALEAMNAKTVFGTPTVVFEAGEFFRAAASPYQGPARFSTEMKAKIVIDLFPAVTGRLEDLDVRKYFKKRFKTGKRFRPISDKILNFHGFNDRPVIPNFMQWWLNTKAKQIVKKVGKL